MKIDISAGRTTKTHHPDCRDYATRLLLRSEGGIDPVIIAAIGRALTGHAPALRDAIADEAERCLEDYRRANSPDAAEERK